MVYIPGENKPSTPASDDCPFCAVQRREDRERTDRAPRRAGVRGAQPLSRTRPGHLLICPYRHVADYTDLTMEETAEVAA